MSAPKHFLVLEWHGIDESDFAVVGPFELDEHRDWFWTTFSAADFNGWDNWGWDKAGEIYGSYSGHVKSPAEFIEVRPRDAVQWSAAQARASQLKAVGFDVSRVLQSMEIPKAVEGPLRVAARESLQLWAQDAGRGSVFG